LHVALIVAFVYGGIHVARVVMPETITVQITETKPQEKLLPPPPPPLVEPQVQTIAPPDVIIRTEAPPPTITVQTVAKPAPQQPPQPVVAESQQSYLARLLAQLNRAKRYPADAKRSHIQGVVMLHFVMAKDGTVSTFDVAKSSGHEQLDQEALALIQRAQPLPPIPPGFGKEQINAVVPIEFTLR
jgi:TonB family protein